MQALRAGALYFACVFAAGFAFGAVRVSLVVPRLGVRLAELAEMPLMLLVSIAAARWVARRLRLAPRTSLRLATGAIALALLVTAELTLVVALQGLTIRSYLASRDPVSGPVYLVMLLVFALMPLIVGRAQPAAGDA